MDKINLQSPDGLNFNVRRLAELFPSVIVEKKESDGSITQGVDFEKLKLLLGEDIVEGTERYEFSWPGKKSSLLKANRPVGKTLWPCIADSQNWAETKNIYIEGDNFDALKLLQESYLGKVKLIYIDPPYNTGSDNMYYNDDFSLTVAEYEELIGNVDEDGTRFQKNTNTNPRFHSVWCSMIYERLLLARNFLTSDGLLCISIDENEVENLIKICNEVFGEHNFVNLITVKTKIGGVSGSSEGKSLKGATEFLVVYAKNKALLELNPVYIKTPLLEKIKSYEREGKSWKYTSILTNLSGKTLLFEDKKSGYKYYGYKVADSMSISAFAAMNGISEDEVYCSQSDKIFQTTNAQTSVRTTVIEKTEGYDFPMIGLEYIPTKGKNGGKEIEVLYKGDSRRMMMFLSDAISIEGNTPCYLDKVSTLWDDIQYNNLTKEGNVEYPNGKKPIKLIQRLIEMLLPENPTQDDSIIMDFFSGSASTAHAVMQSNIDFGGNRRFIMVQFPEDLDENLKKADANTKKSIKQMISFLDSIKKPHLITEIGKERIRRSAEQITTASPLIASNSDFGFRVFKVGETYMKNVEVSAESLTQEDLFSHSSNIIDSASDLDLLFGCILSWGLPLHLQLKEEIIDDCKILSYDADALVACFSNSVPMTVIDYIAQKKPLRVVFRDSSFADSQAKINVKERFKILSPDTTIKVI